MLQNTQNTYRSTDLAATKADHAANGGNARIVDLWMQHNVPHKAQTIEHRDT